MLGPYYYQHQKYVLGLILSRPGRSQGLLYKHLCYSLINFRRAVKSFSVATHLFRGIIIKIRKSLRWGTPNSVKISKWHYVNCKGMGVLVYFTLLDFVGTVLVYCVLPNTGMYFTLLYGAVIYSKFYFIYYIVL